MEKVKPTSEEILPSPDLKKNIETNVKMETREIVDTLPRPATPEYDEEEELRRAFELEAKINGHTLTPEPTPKEAEPIEKEVSVVLTEEEEKAKRLEKKIKKNRCYHDECNKKLGLMPFECRCKGKFCAKHRYDNAHDCGFDYRLYYNKILTKQNPVVVASKVQQI